MTNQEKRRGEREETLTLILEEPEVEREDDGEKKGTEEGERGRERERWSISTDRSKESVAPFLCTNGAFGDCMLELQSSNHGRRRERERTNGSRGENKPS